MKIRGFANAEAAQLYIKSSPRMKEILMKGWKPLNVTESENPPRHRRIVYAKKEHEHVIRA